MTPAETLLRQRLAALSPVSVEVFDDGAEHVGHANEGRGHFSVIVVSTRFSGLSRIHRHQVVYELVRDLIPSTIHALAIKALAPEEFL